MLRYLSVGNTKVGEFVKQQPRGPANHLFSGKEDKNSCKKYHFLY